MAYHFAKLTLSNGKPVFINSDQIAAVYQLGREDTLVQMAGANDNYFHVKESVEKTVDIIYQAMQD